MIESAVTDLPLPDSPTIPSVLPALEREADRRRPRARVPSRVKKWVARSRTSSSAIVTVSVVRGSRASRRPSAMKFAQRTRLAIATDGTMIAVGCVR